VTAVPLSSAPAIWTTAAALPGGIKPSALDPEVGRPTRVREPYIGRRVPKSKKSDFADHDVARDSAMNRQSTVDEFRLLIE
jgi:hypothetical protein